MSYFNEITGDGLSNPTVEIQGSPGVQSSTVAGGAGAIGGIISSVTAPFLQKWQQDFERHEAGQAWERNIQAWRMQNEYNHPAQVMQRLKEAGLNPHLIYGKGQATTPAGSIAPYQKARSIPYSFDPSGFTSLLSQLSQYHAVKQAMHQSNMAEYNDQILKSRYLFHLHNYSAVWNKMVQDAKTPEERNEAIRLKNQYQRMINRWTGFGLTPSDNVGLRMLTNYSGDAATRDRMMNALGGSLAIKSLLPSLGIGFGKIGRLGRIARKAKPRFPRGTRPVNLNTGEIF